MAHPKTIKEDGRVFKLTKIEVATIYKHPLYALEYQDSAALGVTGAWSVLVIAHASGWPVYKGRWDEKANAFDIDKFIETSKKPIKNFEGHRTKKSKRDFRQFEIAIEDPDPIFTGLISFSLTRKIVMRGSLRMRGSASTTVIKKGDKLHYRCLITSRGLPSGSELLCSKSMGGMNRIAVIFARRNSLRIALKRARRDLTSAIWAPLLLTHQGQEVVLP